jgi:hypothetical protein
VAIEAERMNGRTRRRVFAVLIAALVAVQCGCGSQILNEDTFEAQGDAELEAKARMQHWVAVAAVWVEHAAAPREHRARVSEAIGHMRAALSRYDGLRSRGATRAVIMAGVDASAGAIIADDATGVGVGDDILLVPLALTAAATHLVADARATEHELAQAWNEVLSASGEVGRAVEAALAAAGIQTRDDCINSYVDCQNNARRGFPLRLCQVCMRRCIVDEFRWTKDRECDYKQRR